MDEQALIVTEEEKSFTLHWLDGKEEVVQGRNIAEACANAGIQMGALLALDYFSLNPDCPCSGCQCELIENLE